jgi:hypothetical protein
MALSERVDVLVRHDLATPPLNKSPLIPAKAGIQGRELSQGLGSRDERN